MPPSLQDADRVTGEVVEIYLPLAQAADHLINPRRWRLADYGQAAHGTFDTFDAAVEWFDSTAQVIRGCIRIANASHRHEEAWKLAESLSGWLHIRKDWQVWKVSHEMAEESARHCGAAAHARMLAALGEYHLWQHQTELAESYLQRARARWAEAEHALGLASCLEALGTVEMKKDRPERARELVGEARDLFAAAGRERGVVLMNRRLGETHRHQGDYAKAVGYLEPAQEWFTEEGDLYQQVRNGRSLALALEGFGRESEALALLNTLVGLAESIGAVTDADELRGLAEGNPPGDGAERFPAPSEASRLLALHGNTLNAWADQGAIRVARTPGGHRRYLRADVNRILATRIALGLVEVVHPMQAPSERKK